MIASTTTRNAYTAAGGTQFPYTFRILDESHLLVLKNGVAQTLNSDYTVSGEGDNDGGTVTFTTAPTVADSIVLMRNVPFTQLTDFNDNDIGLAQTREDTADKACMISQQINDLVNGTLRVGLTETVNMQLPAVASRANYLLGFATNGTPLMVAMANAATGGNQTAATVLAQGSSDARTLGELAGQYHDPRNYGCPGDGVNSDDAGLVNCLTQANTDGRPVVMDRGPYVFANGITWPANSTTIFHDTVLIFDNPVNTAGTAVTPGSNSTWLGKVTIKSNTPPASIDKQVSTALHVEDVDGWTAEHVHVENLPLGLEWVNSTNCHVRVLTGKNIKGQYANLSANKGSLYALAGCQHCTIGLAVGANIYKSAGYFNAATNTANQDNVDCHIGMHLMTMDNSGDYPNGFGLNTCKNCSVGVMVVVGGLYGFYGTHNDNAKYANLTVDGFQVGKAIFVNQTGANNTGKGIYTLDKGVTRTFRNIQFGEVLITGTNGVGLDLQDVNNFTIGSAIIKDTESIGARFLTLPNVDIGSLKIANNAGSDGFRASNTTGTIRALHLDTIAAFGVNLVNAAMYLPEIRAKNIAQVTATSDDVVIADVNCATEIGSVWAESTTATQHNKLVNAVATTSVRISGSLYSTNGANAQLLEVNGVPLITVKNGRMYNNARPTTGAWTAGDTVWNTAPAVNGTPGWIAVNAAVFANMANLY